MIQGNRAGWAIAAVIGVLTATGLRAQEVVSSQVDRDPAHAAKREAEFTPWCMPPETGDYWRKLAGDHLPILSEGRGEERRTIYLPNPWTGYWTLEGLTKQELLDTQQEKLKIHDELVNVVAYRDDAGQVTSYWALWVPQSRSIFIKRAMTERGITPGYLDYGFADRARRTLHRFDPYTGAIALAALAIGLGVLAWLLATAFRSWRKARGAGAGVLASAGLLALLSPGALRAADVTPSRVDAAHAEAREEAFIPWCRQAESTDYWNRLHKANIPILTEKTPDGWMRDLYVPREKSGYRVLGNMPKEVLLLEDRDRHHRHDELVSSVLSRNEAGDDRYWALWVPRERADEVREKMRALGITPGRIDYDAGDLFAMWAESVNPYADRLALAALAVALLDAIVLGALRRIGRRPSS